MPEIRIDTKVRKDRAVRELTELKRQAQDTVNQIDKTENKLDQARENRATAEQRRISAQRKAEKAAEAQRHKEIEDQIKLISKLEDQQRKSSSNAAEQRKKELDVLAKQIEKYEAAANKASAKAQKIADKVGWSKPNAERDDLINQETALAEKAYAARKQRAALKSTPLDTSDADKIAAEIAAARARLNHLRYAPLAVDTTAVDAETAAISREEARIKSLESALESLQEKKEEDTEAVETAQKNVDKVQRRIYREQQRAARKEEREARRAERAAARSEKSGKGGLSAKKLLGYTLGIRSLYALLGKVRQAISQGFQNLAKFDSSTNKYLSTIKSAGSQVSNSLSAMIAPLLSVVAPAVEKVLGLVSSAANAIGRMFAKLTGQKTFVAATKVQEDYAASLENSQQTLASFDEINTIDTGSGAGGGAGAFATESLENVEIPAGLQRLADFFKKLVETGKRIGTVLKDVFKTVIAPLVGPVLSAALDWLSQKLDDLATWVEDHREGITKWVSILTEIGLIIGVVAAAVLAVNAAVSLLTAAPILLIIAALAALMVKFGYADEAIELFKGVFKDMVSFIGNVISGDWAAAWKNLVGIVARAGDLVIIALESLVKFVLEAFNWLIDKIDGGLKAIGGKGISWRAATDWEIPFRFSDLLSQAESTAGRGGSSHYTAVPLARGAVIPANQRFLAMLGDQTAGRNLEAPEALIRQIVREETSQINVGVEFMGSLAQLARVLTPAIKTELQRQGVSLAKGEVR